MVLLNGTYFSRFPDRIDKSVSKSLVIEDSWKPEPRPEPDLETSDGMENLLDLLPNMTLTNWDLTSDDPDPLSSVDQFDNDTDPSWNVSMAVNDSLGTYFDNESLPIDMRFNDGHVLLISSYSSIFFISLVGNLCVLRAILGGGRKQRKSRVNVMLLHLAIADLIVSITDTRSGLPQYVSSKYTY